MKAFFTYLSLVARSGWGIVGGISLAVWLIGLFVGSLEGYRWFGFAVGVVAILLGGFSVYQRQLAQIGELEQRVIELQTPTFSAERFAAAKDQWKGLSDPEKEAVRHLLIHGELTEKQAVRHLQDKKIAIGMQNVFYGIADHTGLVQRTFQGSTGTEHVHGYLGTYQVNPEMRESLMEIVSSES